MIDWNITILYSIYWLSTSIQGGSVYNVLALEEGKSAEKSGKYTNIQTCNMSKNNVV